MNTYDIIEHLEKETKFMNKYNVSTEDDKSNKAFVDIINGEIYTSKMLTDIMTLFYTSELDINRFKLVQFRRLSSNVYCGTISLNYKLYNFSCTNTIDLAKLNKTKNPRYLLKAIRGFNMEAKISSSDKIKTILYLCNEMFK